MRAYMSDRAARHASLYTGYPSSDDFKALGHLPIPECEAKVKLAPMAVACVGRMAEWEALRILSETEQESMVPYTKHCRFFSMDQQDRARLAEALATFVNTY